jgi:type IV pilus assembly protein PilB
LPISKVGATLTLAMADPTNVFAMDDIKFMTGLECRTGYRFGSLDSIAIGKYYSATKQIEVFDLPALARI